DDSTPAHAPVGPECGVSIGGPCVDSVSTYARAVNLRNQILCLEPASYCSLGSGMPLQYAYDRTAISRANNRMFTPGDSDLAVNSSQIFTPPYLYDSSIPCATSVGCKLAKRPVIGKGPDYIHYGKKFKIKVDDAGAIKMVSLIRTGSATHTLAQDQVYVRVPFKIKKDKEDNKGK